jgi:2-polyprenyl-6-methoxyphenol hydroxylase-like FAD-dependent oxidoreductase
LAIAKQNDIDAVVIGGGVAGLTAALQLKELRPKTRIAVLEKRLHPVPPTAHKVGESIADVATHYLENVIGLDDYLEKEHLRKMGLRWFCSSNGNTDITSRVEFGLIRFSPIRTFHVDRGAIENHLADLVCDRGIDFRDAANVSRVELGADHHTISFTRNGKTEALRARWVVDASGRHALLRNKLGTGIHLPNSAGASWFRTPEHLTIDEWSDNPAWQAQVPSGTRWRSTVSFVGKGYWIWVINLPSGAASVGVVADPEYVPWERIRRYDALLEWLREAEPQIAAHLPDSEDGLLDFMKRKDFSHSCTRAFSRRRWALTGEAAVFLDPLYSTGHDTTAIANTLLTDLIRRDLDGEGGPAFTQRLRSHNRVLLGLIQLALDIFPKQLAVYGQPQATGCKIWWDNASYFGILLSLFRGGGILNPELMRSLQPILVHSAQMNSFMQARFRDWGTSDKDFRSAGIPTVSDFFIEHLFTTPLQPMSHDELYEYVHLSVTRLDALGEQMVSRMSAAAGETAPKPPHAAVGCTDEDLLMWSDYDRRTGPPAEREPQPADGWGIR